MAKKKKSEELAALDRMGPNSLANPSGALRPTITSDLMYGGGGSSGSDALAGALASLASERQAAADLEGWQSGGKLLGDLAVLAGAAGSGGGKYIRQGQDLVGGIPLPELERRRLSAPQLQRVADYSPEAYDAQISRDPEIPLGSPEMRGHQAAALRYLQRVGDEGLPLAERLRAEELQRSMAQQAQRNQAAILQNMAARGRLSGGDELAARIIGNQQSSDLARASGADLAQLSTLNRLSGERSAADLSGQIRGQDFGEQGEQANVLNRFNEFASNLMTQAAMDAAASQERAGYSNVARSQNVSDRNVAADYNVALSNRNYGNTMNQADFENRLAKVDRQSAVLGAMARQADAEQAARANLFSGIGQGVGTVAGAAVGGPLGGAAGAGLGTGLGNLFG